MKRWILPIILGAVALAALAGALTVGKANAEPATTGGQSAAACTQLMSDPATSKAIQTLHADHVKDMQAWQTKYGTDPTSAAAQRALAGLRKEHLSDMRALFQKLGIKAPAGLDSMMGGAGGMMGGTGTDMMGGSVTGSDAHAQHHGGGSTAGGNAPSGMMGGSSGGMMGGTTL
jgi:hypothetical protein